MAEILINFYVPDATDQEAREAVHSILPFDPDADPRHIIESWVEVKPHIQPATLVWETVPEDVM